jgi:hypothetical protein
LVKSITFAEGIKNDAVKKNTNVEDKSKPFTPSCLDTTKSSIRDSTTARISLSIGNALKIFNSEKIMFKKIT